jgi:5-hydroxyisourate hydrolase
MAGKLTTHVLDTSRGCPARGVGVCLWRLGANGGRQKVCETQTNDDGRVSAPLMEGDNFILGEYELNFNAGAYFAAANQKTFLGLVAARFVVGEDSHYHIPLLLSPFAYSVYRGS